MRSAASARELVGTHGPRDPAMSHMMYQPGPPLDGLVDFFWTAECYVASTPRERILPSGTVSLVIHLEPRPVRIYSGSGADDLESINTSGLALCGARTTPMVIGAESLGATIGIHFKPGGNGPFFDVPAEEFAEQVVPLEALWGATATRLRERLMEATSSLARVRLMQEALLQRARRPFAQPAALRESLHAFEQSELESVAEVNRRTGLSPKRLLALYRDQVGLSPKAFWRVRRFRAALGDLENGTDRGASLAARHGYFDQAHFLREFRAFAGSNPREYLAARIVGTDHVAVYGKKDPSP